MKLNEAVKAAETFINGKVKDTGYTGFREVMARLLAEVKKNDDPAAQDPCRCHACQIAEEMNEISEHDTAVIAVAEYIKTYGNGKCVSDESAAALAGEIIEAFMYQSLSGKPEIPLPDYLLADTADQLADALDYFAGDLNLHHVKYERDFHTIKRTAKWFTGLAKQLREDT